jgi:hypothetical protein
MRSLEDIPLWARLLIGLLTILITLLMILLFSGAESGRLASAKVEVGCMDPTERERVRDIALRGIDKGLEEQVMRLFEVWMKDPGDQPRRAMVGTNNAVNAHIRARKQATEWDPPIC